MLELGHVALFVADLRAAEAFYQRAFGLEVLFREVETDDGTFTLREGRGWDEAHAAGVDIGVVFLHRDQFLLPIFAGDPQPGTVLEVGITASPTQIDAVRAQLPEEATLLPHEYGDLYFADPFGYTWHLYSASEKLLSNGELSGAWLDL